MAARQGRTSTERARLTKALNRAEAERRKLLDAYYARAIDVAMLKSEQARIGAEVRTTQQRLDGVDADIDEWKDGPSRKRGMSRS
ncbi:MAG: hypothetical protein ACRD0Q_09850 [Acidimicrobiales bacterium]